MLSAMLVTANEKREIKTGAILVFIFCFPSVGLYVSGNYTLPVLAGAALLLYVARKEDASLSVLGIVLLTFKPHIGILGGLFGYGWLWTQKALFARQARWMTPLAGIILL